MTNLRASTDIHPQTVTAVSTGDTPQLRRQRRGKGTWNSPVARSQVPEVALHVAIERAGGDPNRLWFDTDGSVWILNHSRMTTCPSPACPPCSARRTDLP